MKSLCFLPLLLVVACSADSHGNVAARTRPARDRNPVVPAQLEWEVHPYRVQALINPETSFEPLGFRAGLGIIALLHHDPPMRWVFMHHRPKYPAGGPFLRGREVLPPFDFPVDIVGISEPGKAWLLEPARGRITSQDLGLSVPEVLGILHIRQRVRRGCLLSDRHLAYLDDARPHEIFVKSFDSSPRTDTLPFPPEWTASDSTWWASLRFGGAGVGRCVLWGPEMEVVLRVSATGTVPIGPLIEPPRSARSSAALARWMRRNTHAPLVGDATTFPGGVAVLMAGSGEDARRVIDVYGEDGRFVKALRLARPALRIAGSEQRIYALSWRHDSLFLASYLLPTMETPDEVAMPYVPPSPRGIRPADSADTGRGRP